MLRRLRSLAGVGASTAALAVVALAAVGLTAHAAPSPRHAAGSTMAALANSGRGWVATAGVGVVGARVTVTAWPNAATLAALPYGATVPLAQVGSATTDASGSYSLTMDMATLNDRYRAVSGAVNVEIDVAGPQGTSARWNAPIAGSAIRSAPAHVALPAFGFDLSARRVSGPGIASAGSPLAVSQARPTAETTQEPVASPGPPQPCKVVALARVPDRPERFLDVHAWSGAKARVEETYGSAHTVGVGVSADGQDWSASGDVDVESGDSTTVITPAFADSRWVGNSINYRKFATWCPSGYSAWRVQSTGLNALLPEDLTTHKVPKPHFKHCSPYGAGYRYKRDHGRNVTYSGGVRLGFLRVSAHAEMTHQTLEIWDLTRRSWVCGNRESLQKSTQIAVMRRGRR